MFYYSVLLQTKKKVEERKKRRKVEHNHSYSVAFLSDLQKDNRGYASEALVIFKCVPTNLHLYRMSIRDSNSCPNAMITHKQ